MKPHRVGDTYLGKHRYGDHIPSPTDNHFLKVHGHEIPLKPNWSPTSKQRKSALPRILPRNLGEGSFRRERDTGENNTLEGR